MDINITESLNIVCLISETDNFAAFIAVDRGNGDAMFTGSGDNGVVFFLIIRFGVDGNFITDTDLRSFYHHRLSDIVQVHRLPHRQHWHNFFY